MANGIKALRTIELGQEAATAVGTPVAGSTLWRGEGTISDDREVVFPNEDVGYLSGLDRSYIPKVMASINFADTPATFEQLPYVCEAGIKAIGDGIINNSAYISDYKFPTTAVNTLQYFTIEGGDNNQYQEMEYSFVRGFTLSGVAGESWMLGADWVGRQASNASVTGSAVPAVEEILFSKTKLYIDAVGGTIGSTQVSDTLLDANITVNTGWIPVWTAEGNLYFSFSKMTAPEITMNVTMEYNTSAVAEVANWVAETPRLIRLEVEGSALATAATGTATYSNKVVEIDMAGKWEKFEPISDNDGNDTISAIFRARYNATGAEFCDINVVNESTLL
jgi:hypothetical protein